MQQHFLLNTLCKYKMWEHLSGVVFLATGLELNYSPFKSHLPSAGRFFHRQRMCLLVTRFVFDTVRFY